MFRERSVGNEASLYVNVMKMFCLCRLASCVHLTAHCFDLSRRHPMHCPHGIICGRSGYPSDRLRVKRRLPEAPTWRDRKPCRGWKQAKPYILIPPRMGRAPRTRLVALVLIRRLPDRNERFLPTDRMKPLPRPFLGIVVSFFLTGVSWHR